MERDITPACAELLAALPPLPLSSDEWSALTKSLCLSDRQAEVAALVVRGADDKLIMRALGIRQSTLRTFRDRLAARTGARRRSELVARLWAASLKLK